MNEILKEEKTNVEFERANDVLIEKGLLLMEKKYGKGFMRIGEEKPYHTRRHVEDVIKFVEQMGPDALANGIISSEHEIQIMKLAAAWHDAVSDRSEEVDGQDMETMSANLLEKEMRNTYDKNGKPMYTEDDIAFARKLILGTKVTYLADGVIKQASENGDEIQKMFSDADVANFGMEFNDLKERFTAIAYETKRMDDWIFKEKLSGIPLVLRLYRWQLNFLENAKFLSQYAQDKYSDRFRENVKILRERVHRMEDIERGHVETVANGSQKN